jgi:hypothetical protein
MRYSLKMFPCEHPDCGAVFRRRFNRNRHFERSHIVAEDVFQCNLCGQVFNTRAAVQTHRRTHLPTTGFTELRQAFGRSCVIYRKVYAQKTRTFEEAFLTDKTDIRKLIKYHLEVARFIKVSASYCIEFVKVDPAGDVYAVNEFFIRSEAHTCLNSRDIYHFSQKVKRIVQNRIDDFVNRGSGWIMDEVLYADLEVVRCRSLNR